MTVSKYLLRPWDGISMWRGTISCGFCTEMEMFLTDAWHRPIFIAGWRGMCGWTRWRPETRKIRYHCEWNMKWELDHPGGRAPGGGPLGKKGSTNSPNSGIWIKRCLLHIHFLASSPTPELSFDRRREEGNPLQASPQTPCYKLISYDNKLCAKSWRTYFFICAMSAAEKLFSCLLGGLLLDWTWPPYSESRS